MNRASDGRQWNLAVRAVRGRCMTKLNKQKLVCLHSQKGLELQAFCLSIPEASRIFSEENKYRRRRERGIWRPMSKEATKIVEWRENAISVCVGGYLRWKAVVVCF